MKIRKATKKDLIEIKKLQESNLHKNLTPGQKEKEGFVSVETNLSQLEKINKDIGILVVEEDNKIIAYEMPLGLCHAEKIPLLIPFINRILNLKYQGINLSKYKIGIEGQICISKNYKGKGIAEKLHTEFIKLLKPKYDLILTEVSSQNPRSLHVHTKKLGLQILEQYSAEGKEWYVLLQDIR